MKFNINSPSTRPTKSPRAAIAGRIVRVSVEGFRAGGGRGAGNLQVDLTASPPRVVVDAQLNGAALAPLANRLPPALDKIRGTYSAAGHYEMVGLTAGEISSSIHGHASLLLRGVSFAEFDLLGALARAQGKTPEPSRTDPVLRSASFVVRVEDRRVTLAESPVVIGGIPLRISGVYEFGGMADVRIAPEVRRAASPWTLASGDPSLSLEANPIHLSGPLDRLALVRPAEAVRQAP